MIPTPLVVPTPVHSLESDQPLPLPRASTSLAPADTPSARWRHSGWTDTRTRIWRALLSIACSPSRLEAFGSCGENYRVYRSLTDAETFQVRPNACHDRFCLPCARSRSNLIARRVLAKIQGTAVRFVTLTYRTESEPLADSLRGLYEAFARLRRSPLWRKHVTGGVAFLEIKWISESDRWHPHLHILVQGTYIPKPALQQQWLKATGHSMIVDIQLVRSAGHAAKYVTKYAGKPFNTSFTHNHDLLCEAIKALTGRKLALTFGSWRGYRLTTPDPSTGWEYMGSLPEMIARALAGDATARKAVKTTPAGLLDLLCEIARAPPPPTTTPTPKADPQLTLFDGAWYR